MYTAMLIGSFKTHLSPDIVDHFDLVVVVKLHLSRHLSEVKVVRGLHVFESDMEVLQWSLTE